MKADSREASHLSLANNQQKISDIWGIIYVSVKDQWKILIRKTERWKYIKKNVFLKGQYFDMVYLILWIQKFSDEKFITYKIGVFHFHKYLGCVFLNLLLCNLLLCTTVFCTSRHGHGHGQVLAWNILGPLFAICLLFGPSSSFFGLFTVRHLVLIQTDPCETTGPAAGYCVQNVHNVHMDIRKQPNLFFVMIFISSNHQYCPVPCDLGK